MTDVTLTRDTTTIDIPLLSNTSGDPLIARDIGKPNIQFQETGRINPRSNDQWSGLENVQIFGQYTTSDAYDNAIALADLIKSASGKQTTLSTSINTVPDMTVVPLAEQERALQLTYPPGRRDWVEVELGLTRVDRINGSGQSATTPTDRGAGPIQITDGSTTVSLTADIGVTRTIGRPNSVVRRQSGAQYPYYVEHRKSAYDEFELSLEFVDTVDAKTNDLISLFNTRRQRDSLTLDFNGIYNMGSFDVMPSGSRALRQVEPSAQEGVKLIPEVNLRVVNNA